MTDFKGQQKFQRLLDTDFGGVFAVIQSSDTFQDGWKELTGLPQKGNHNPNYKDCLAYIEEVTARDLHTRHTCPLLPVETRLNDPRARRLDQTYWGLMGELCRIYAHFVQAKAMAKHDDTEGQGVKVKKSVNYLFNNGYILPFVNDYDVLWSLICNPSSDILEVRVAQ
jgi:hypothetical protein